MSEVAAASAPRDGALRRVSILVTLTFVTMLYAMTVTIANVSLPQMQGALSATQDQIAWVVTFNIVATAVATPMSGWLTARLGRRRCILWCVLGFTLASLMCGLATSVEELVLYRILQGACGAPLVPVSQAIVVETYPREQTSSVMAIFGMGVILGPIAGPVLGGYLSEAYSWRWVFFMIVPLAAATFVAVWLVIRDKAGTRDARLDWTGFLALACAIAALQLMLDRGERNDWFQSTETVVEAAVAVVALYVFVVHCSTAERPFFSPRLLKDRNFAIGLWLAFLFGMLNFTPITLLPALLQNLRGYPDSVIGYVLAYRGVGTLVGFFVMMLVGSRIDPRVPFAAGFVAQGVAGWQMASFDINLTMAGVAWTTALQGFGVGLCWPALAATTFWTLPPRDVADGTGMFHLLRNIGSSVHISLSVFVVIHFGRASYAELAPLATPTDERVRLPWVVGGWDLGETRSLAGLAAEVQRQATMIGYLDAFAFFAVTAAVAVPFVLLVRRR